MVYAAEADVWLAVQDLVMCDLDTINGRAAATPCLHTIHQRHRMQAQWRADRDRMTHARLWLVWCHDHDLAKIPYGLNEVSQTRGRYPVVIGDEYDWLFLLLAFRTRFW